MIYYFSYILDLCSSQSDSYKSSFFHIKLIENIIKKWAPENNKEQYGWKMKSYTQSQRKLPRAISSLTLLTFHHICSVIPLTLFYFSSLFWLLQRRITLHNESHANMLVVKFAPSGVREITASSFFNFKTYLCIICKSGGGEEIPHTYNTLISSCLCTWCVSSLNYISHSHFVSAWYCFV